MLLLLTCFIGAITARVWTVGDVGSADYRANELVAAIAKASAGDIIELLGGEFVVMPNKASNIALIIDKSLTIRTSADANARSILRAASSDGIDALIGVGANNVVLENFVVGKPLGGLAFSTERLVCVYVSAGTQATPSGLSTNNYNSPAADLKKKKRAPGLGAVQIVRQLDMKRSVSFDEANRLLRNVVIRNVDFSAAGAHTGVAFGMGSYSNARVERSTFAADANTDAIVSVVGALFDETSLIDLSIFNGAQVVIKGNGPAIGTNYWAPALRGQHETFCIDRGCTHLGPVVDGDQFNSRAFATIADAVAAKVRKIVVTGRTVDLYRSGSSPVTIVRPGTTIQGVVADNCEPDADGTGASVATINIRNAQNGNGGALVSLDCALAHVSNVIFMLQADSPHIAIAFVPQDATRKVASGANEEDLGNEALFENVKFLGDSTGQIAIHSASPITHLGVSASSFAGFGIQHDAGRLNVDDCEFVDSTVPGITLAGKGKRGLRVSNTLFALSGDAIVFVNVKAGDLLEFLVRCSQFLFANPHLPADCSKGTLCTYAHNTIVAAPKQLTSEERKVFSSGLNHYEEDTLDNIGKYAAFTGKADRSQITFALSDHQGRIDDVSGVVTMVGVNTRWHFALVSSIPMRQECFASSVPSGNDPQGPARVVSNYIRVASDAPKQCVSVAIRVSLSGAEVGLHDGEDLSIYAVQHLGGALTKWTRAVSHTISIDDNGASVAVEASSGGGTLMRAVVVAAHASQAEKAAALSKNVNQLAAGSNAVLVATKLDLHLCVACGTDHIPAQISDERCGGGLQQPIFKSIEDALAEVQKIPATAKTTSVSILVYGTQCAIAKCSLDLATTAPVTKLVVEGLAIDVRGTLRRPSSCNRETPFVNVNSRGVTLRYLVLGADTSLLTAIPKCVINVPASLGEGPRIAFTSIGGGVCIGDKRPKTMLLGNEIAAAPKTTAIAVVNGESLTLESNSVMIGNVLFGVFGGAIVTANRFGPDVSIVGVTKETSTTALKLSGNVFASRRADGTASEITCIDAGISGIVQSIGDSFGDNCILLLGKKSSVANSVLNNVAVIATDGRFVNVTLTGLNSKIKSIGLAVLETVRIDLTTTQLGIALPGEPKRQFPCAKLYEARLATYDLAKSTIYDLSSGKRLLVEATTRWPTVPTAFVSPSDGSVINCVKDSTDDYCLCAAGKPIAPKTTLPPTSVTKKPTATPAANVFADGKASVVVANDRKKQLATDPQCAAACVGVPTFIIGPCRSLDIRDVAGALSAPSPRCQGTKCVGPGSSRTETAISCASEACVDASTDGTRCGCTTCSCFYRDESEQLVGADSCELPPTPKPTPQPTRGSNTNTILAFVLIFGLIFCCCICCCCFFFCILGGSAARLETDSTTQSPPYRPLAASSSTSTSSGPTVTSTESALTGFMLHDESGLRKRNAN